VARRDTAARRYAEAAFEIARSDGKLDAWERDLRRIGELMRDAELRRILEHPVVPYAD
jgi:F-type H+-transporting ATPase subunit delta